MSVFKNPYFISACLVFWLNQFLERVLNIFIPYVHAYLDDLLAMPVILGITLQVYRWIHPLKDGFTFSKTQVFVGWLYFSFLFEFLLPRWSSTYTADLLDVVCYGIGAIAFYKLINKKK
jgi:radical SAM superfamily enzyme YgiQ (UPF0313 family)